ncbi:unnamed protein product, partial [marine sediment metagenome]
ERGNNYGAGRNNQYGIGQKDVRDYYEASNRETMVIALIESAEGVKNIDQICAVPGLDATWLGPSDLAQSMGLPPQQAVDEAVGKVVDATIRAGKILAVTHLPPNDTEKLQQFMNKGARMLSTRITQFIRLGATEWQTTVKKLASELT